MDIRSSLRPQETNNTSKMVPSPRFINFIAPRRSWLKSNRKAAAAAGENTPLLCVASVSNQINTSHYAYAYFGMHSLFLLSMLQLSTFWCVILFMCDTTMSFNTNVMEILARKRSGIIQIWFFRRQRDTIGLFSIDHCLL